MHESPQAKTALDAIRAEFAPREKEIQTQGAALKAREEKLTKDAATMTEVQRAAADKELRDGYRELQRKQAEVQDDFNARRNEEMSPPAAHAARGSAGLCQGAGLTTWCWLKACIYATSPLDITASILTALQSRRAGAPAAAPAAPKPAREALRRAPSLVRRLRQ